MTQKLELVIGSINYFTKPVGRGCAWFHVNSNNRANNFILVVDEDIDLRIINRLNKIVNLLAGTPYKIAMAGERKGSITILLEPDIYSDFSKPFNKSKIIDVMENGAHPLDPDFWGAKLFLPDFNEDFEVDPELLNSIAYPEMKKEVFWFLLKEKEKHQDLIAEYFFKEPSND